MLVIMSQLVLTMFMLVIMLEIHTEVELVVFM